MPQVTVTVRIKDGKKSVTQEGLVGSACENILSAWRNDALVSETPTEDYYRSPTIEVYESVDVSGT